MKCYVYAQNNSGGKFIVERARGIGKFLFIEAPHESRALAIAQSVGLYLDGVADGYDCPCCGNRWSSYADEYDSVDEAVADVTSSYQKGWASFWEDSFVHYADGKITLVKQDGTQEFLNT